MEVSMASGRKTGGRALGTPNKKTVELAQRLADIGCDPVEGMAVIAMDEGNLFYCLNHHHDAQLGEIKLLSFFMHQG